MFARTILIQIGIFLLILLVAAVIEYIIIKYKDSNK